MNKSSHPNTGSYIASKILSILPLILISKGLNHRESLNTVLNAFSLSMNGQNNELLFSIILFIILCKMKTQSNTKCLCYSLNQIIEWVYGKLIKIIALPEYHLFLINVPLIILIHLDQTNAYIIT